MGEIIYHVDEQDNVLGSIDRDEAHRKEVLHRSGMVFVINLKGEIFLQHRANKKTFPNCYDASSTFHVPFGETYEEAAKREVFEELGLQIELKFLGKFAHHDPPEHQNVSVFIAGAEEIPKLDPTEAYSGEWCTIEKLSGVVASGDTTPWLRDGFKVLLHHLSLKK